MEGNGWVKTVDDGANTNKPKQWWEWLPLFSLRRVKPMSIDQELPSLTKDINTQYKIQPSPYNYDRQIMIPQVNTCHKNQYKSNNNHNTI